MSGLIPINEIQTYSIPNKFILPIYTTYIKAIR